MRMRIFLLGGTGYIGSVLIGKLAADRQKHQLMALVHRRAPYRQLEQVDTYSGSLGSFDLSLLDRFQPDTLVHLARMSGTGRLGRFWAAFRGSRANRRIIRHLRNQRAKPHVIYVSGSLVYGDGGEADVDEASPIKPTSFALEYIKAEQPWMDEAASGGLPVTILRPPWIIGRGSWFAGFYLNSIRQHGTVPLFGDGRNLMSLLDVEDCAGLIAHALQHARPGLSYNLFAPGACLTQLEFARKLSAQTGATIRQLGNEEIRRTHGQAVLEAFTFSSRIATRHPEFAAGYRFKFPTVDDMIAHSLAVEPCEATRTSCAP